MDGVVSVMPISPEELMPKTGMNNRGTCIQPGNTETKQTR
jgi:hypothetical protein